MDASDARQVDWAFTADGAGIVMTSANAEQETYRRI